MFPRGSCQQDPDHNQGNLTWRESSGILLGWGGGRNLGDRCAVGRQSGGRPARGHCDRRRGGQVDN
ncbi:hypothetical protein RvY_00272 [Ramazzottius varieornatus]|uniref:Uncharacterized protein n=1 Tax=Ramazzottius varieornatus TaxID=947166 RepID=A0A1D1UM59_RAMVA|nr:hypothetical protein RvY_00272 [Ramazzottius varieornatus]